MKPPHILERHHWLPVPVEEVFEFFAGAHNLARITPSWMGFAIQTPTPIEMQTGDYRIRMGPLPMRWGTLISEWEEGSFFCGCSGAGPLALWVHRHDFEAAGTGTLVRDRVEYRLPAGILGRIAHFLWVRQTLNAIFDFRFAAIERFFATREPAR